MLHNVKIICSSRKSLSLSITSENQIILRCPEKMAASKIDLFLESKKSWIERVIFENKTKRSLYGSIVAYREILVGGNRLPLIISDRNAVTSQAVFVKSIKDVKKTFILFLSGEFTGRAQRLCEITGLRANGFSLRKYKSRWGCCDGLKRIKLNYLLLMLPYELQRYVIIHELCHTVYLNHSKNFWNLVSKFEPEYIKLKKWLKSFDFLINLY